jgi:hypothetical protein
MIAPTARVAGAVAAASLLAAALLCRPTGGAADTAGSPPEPVTRDIYVAITLAGYHCGAVSTVVETGALDYSVRCRNGKLFRVYATGDTVHVVDRSPGDRSAPAPRDDHDSLVARSLFAIVNLSGYDCDEVVGIERAPRREYRVRCGNGTQYRIAVAGDGRVAVERIR